MPGSLLIGISSPYRRAGLLWCEVQAGTGARRAVCWWSRRRRSGLNPGIDRATIAEAYEDDPEAARAEWGAEFRRHWRTSSSREVVEALVSPGV